MPRPATGQVVERESKSGVVTFAFPIRVYARAVRRKEKLTGAHREAFDAAIEWALLGTNAEDVPSESGSSNGSEPRKRLPRAIN